MKDSTLEHLCCPRRDCSGALAPGPNPRRHGAEILEGLLDCGSCGAAYPVVAGVAVLVADPLSWIRANYYYVVEGAAAAGGIGPALRSWLEERGWHLGNAPADNYYEMPRWLNMFTATHYDATPAGADDHTPLGRFIAGQPQVFDVLAELLQAHLPEPPRRALDVGTNVGGMAHRCGKLAEEVIGVDNAYNAILTARRINQGVPAPVPHYRRYLEGHRYEERPLPGGRGNTEFLLASAYGLPLKGRFGLITALNVVDVVPDPLALLQVFHERLEPGGLLAMSSPYSWGLDDAPVERWIGGSRDQPSAAAMTAALREMGFEILEETDGVPWVLREHQRWYRVFLNHCLVARRR